MSAPSMRSSHTSDPYIEKERDTSTLDVVGAENRHDGSSDTNAAAVANTADISTSGAPIPPTAEAPADADPEKTAGPAPSSGRLPPPDGGSEAWLSLLGGFCCLFCTFGWINAIGVFQSYYQTELLPTYSPSSIAWILSLETFFMFFGGIWVGLLFDNYGPRPLLLVGMVLHVFGLMMVSLSTEYWQLLLAQGLCSPLGAAPVFYSAMSSTVTWFDKKRGLALGIMASGSSLGGVIFPIMLQRLIPAVGFPWAMRAAAFLILGMLSIAVLTVKPRNAPVPRRFHPSALTKPFKSLNFTVLAAGCFCVFFALFIPFAFVPLGALAVGVDPSLEPYVIPILNAVSIAGRITPGWLSDRVGRFNVTVATSLLCGVFVLALWLPARSPGPVLAFAACYGFASGAFVSIVPALVAAVSPDLREIGTNVGVLFAFISVAALTGSPVGGALLQADGGSSGGAAEGASSFTYLCIFTGVITLVGTVGIAVVRVRLAGPKLTARV